MSALADICIISEGSYPYVRGGVASWIHDMVSEIKEYKFHIVSLISESQSRDSFYAMPSNVIGHDTHVLGRLPAGKKGSLAISEDMHARLRPLLMGLIDGVPFDRNSFSTILRVLATYRDSISSRTMLNDKAAWETMLSTYESAYKHLSFLDFFWSYRVMLSSLSSTLTFPMPPARLYHAISTGYAGLFGARAKHENGAPFVITEHGIYTNERRIEILAADWLQKHRTGVLSVDNIGLDLRDMWVRYFEKMGLTAYEAADQVLSLFSGNQTVQWQDGASEEKTRVIPNGIDVDRFSALPRQAKSAPTVALIGRIVPIKDIKGFVHAIAVAKHYLPELNALVIGPTDEDAGYARECQELIDALGLRDTIRMTGMVNVDDYLPSIDVVVLTSISEAQPLALLEAGAAGIPLIATDVGACKSIMYGMDGETPAYGDGGIITPLANPQATAEAIVELLTNRARYLSASTAIKQRVRGVYHKQRQYDAYRNLYQSYVR